MEYIKLNNGIEMPVLGLGTYEGTDKGVALRSVREALDVGYRLIDTAQYYGNEQYIGQAIRESGVPREEIFLTSKIWFNRFEECYEAVLESLRTLQVDYIDLILLHWPFGNTYKAYRDLERLYEEGKVRSIGVSNFRADRLIDIARYNKVVPAVNQIETNLLCQQRQCHEWMERLGVRHEGYAPFGQGLADDIYADPCLQAIAEEHGKSTRQVALRFLIQQGVTVIPKSARRERMEQNIDVFDFQLTEEEMQRLAAFDRRVPLTCDPAEPGAAWSSDQWKG